MHKQKSKQLNLANKELAFQKDKNGKYAAELRVAQNNN